MAVLMLVCTVMPAFAEDYTFQDTNGKTVTIPDGAGASRVVEFKPGENWDFEGRMKVEGTLGMPEDPETREPYTGIMTLGAGGVLVLEYDVAIYDGDGPDLYVFEVGPAAEKTKVEVSNDLQTWYNAGTAGGLVSGINLNGKVPEGRQFHYVRLTDLRTVPDGDFPGADIDAVCGVNVVPEGVGASRVVEFTHGDNWTDFEGRMKVESTLGLPDDPGTKEPYNGYMTLGAGGVLVLEYDVAIYDGDGQDIFVFEVGPGAEKTKVEVSDDLKTWYDAGTAKGLVSGIDLNGKVPDGSRFRYVRLTDQRTTPNERYAGADIDAVCGVNVMPISSTWAQTEVEKAKELDLIPEILENKDLTLNSRVFFLTTGPQNA